MSNGSGETMKVPDWDGKIVLAGVFTIAYFTLAVYIIKFGSVSPNQKDLALVVLAATGPQLGQIFTSLFRTTAADERQALLRSGDLRSAIETPSAAAPAIEDVAAAVEKGVKRGVESAEPVQVHPTGESPSPRAADGRIRDWLDEPVDPPVPSAPSAVAPAGDTPVLED
jgi:hypothetical protein